MARRLQSLGALTRGDRRAASGLDLSDSNLDSAVGRKALRRLYEALMEGGSALPAGVTLPDIVADDDDAAAAAPTAEALHIALAPCTAALGLGAGAGAEDAAAGAPDAAGDKAATAKDLGDVRRFLNRLLAMPVALQNLLYRSFAATLAAELRAAQAEGQHSEGVSDLPAADIRLAGAPAELWRPPHSTLATTATRLQLDRGVSFDAALEVLKATGQPVDPADAESFKPSTCPGAPPAMVTSSVPSVARTHALSNTLADGRWLLPQPARAVRARHVRPCHPPPRPAPLVWHHAA